MEDDAFEEVRALANRYLEADGGMPLFIGKPIPSSQSSCLADDDSPGSDGPRGDQAIADIRITDSEALHNGAIVRPPNEYRSIRRLGKGACEDQVPTPMDFPSQR